MRVTLLSPAALGPPAPLPAALAEWAGAVRAAGHAVRVLDLNAEAADRLTSSQRLTSLVERSRDFIAAKDRAGEFVSASWYRTRLDAAEPHLLAGAASKATLRDPRRFFEPDAFRGAFFGVTAAIDFIYQLDTRLNPRRAGAGQEILDVLQKDPWSPLEDVYAEELLDVVSPAAADVFVVRADSNGGLFDAFRLAQRIRRRARHATVAVGGPPVATLFANESPDPRFFDLVDAVIVDDASATVAAFVEAARAGRSFEDVRGLVVRTVKGEVRRTPAPVREDDAAPIRPFFDAADAAAFAPRPVRSVRFAGGAGPKARRLRLAATALAEDARAPWVRVEDERATPEDCLLFAEAVRGANAPFFWGAACEIDRELLEPGYAASLAAGGCRSLALRLRSAAPAVRAQLDEPVGAEELPRVLDHLRRAGISADLCFEIGNPGESRVGALETMRFFERHRGDFGLPVFEGIRVEPDGSDRWAKERDPSKWIPEVRAGFMAKEELKPIVAMLERFDHRPILRLGLQIPFAAQGRPHRGEFGRPFAIPREFAAFCTPYPVEPGASPEVFTSVGEQVAFDDDFGFRSRLEAAFEDIRREYFALPKEMRVEYRDAGATDGYWAQIGFYGATMRVHSACAKAPKLAAILDSVPGIYTAGFSIVGPRTRLTPHCGEDRTLLRCHLSVDIPGDSGFVVGGVPLHWVEGKTIAFDDTLPHAAWNGSDREKVLLMIDFRASTRIAQGFTPTPEQMARDRAHYVHLFPEWTAESDASS
jgi:ornithine lipid ester-linked acyl 2-hydroxylase